MQFGFYNGDVQTMIKEDLPLMKPTIFASVPRIYNRLHDKLKDGFSKAGGCKGWLVNRALSAKLENLNENGALTHPCYDRLVFNKVKGLLGGKVRIMLTGSAPIAADVLNFLKVCFCAEII